MKTWEVSYIDPYGEEKKLTKTGHTAKSVRLAIKKRPDVGEIRSVIEVVDEPRS